MSKKHIDINCDLGEGGVHDEQLMQFISSCNIACGGHFGNQETVDSTVQMAIENKVNIGAHPSYPDRENFGRKSIIISTSEFKQTIRDQILLVKGSAEKQNATLYHVKAHGSLYQDLIYDENLACAFLDIIKEVDDKLAVFAPPHSCMHHLSNNTLKIYTEGFADRAYGENYNLLPRSLPLSVLSDKEVMAKQVLDMIQNGQFPSMGSSDLPAKIDTVCVHSDNDNALEILIYLNKELQSNNIQLKAI